MKPNQFTPEILQQLQDKGLIRGYTQRNKALAEAKASKRNKYGNKKTVIDGLEFDSQKEARRYTELRILAIAGDIKDLRLQVEYDLVVEGKVIARYRCDFQYFRDGWLVVEDVKSTATRKLSTYRLKKKLMKQIHNIEIVEL
jgi:ribosomal protein S8